MRRGEVWWAELPKTALSRQVAVLSPEKLFAIDRAFRFALGLED